MALFPTCPCGIAEGSAEKHMRMDCPLYDYASHNPSTQAADRCAEGDSGRHPKGEDATRLSGEAMPERPKASPE